MTTVLAMAINKTSVRNPKGNPLEDDEDVALSEGVSRRIKTLCELDGMTLRDLERKVGCSDGTIAQLVSGRRTGATTLKLVYRIAKELHTSLDFLCDGHMPQRKKGIRSDATSASQAAFLFDPQLPVAAPKRSRLRPATRKKPPQS